MTQYANVSLPIETWELVHQAIRQKRRELQKQNIRNPSSVGPNRHRIEKLIQADISIARVLQPSENERDPRGNQSETRRES